MDQLDLINIYRTFHPETINFTFFSSAHRTFSRIDHIPGHKSTTGKFNKIEIIQTSFLIVMQWDSMSTMGQGVGGTVKNTNIWRLNNTLLSNQKIMEEIKKEIKICIKNKWKLKHNNPNPMRFSKSSAKRKVYSSTSLS